MAEQYDLTSHKHDILKLAEKYGVQNLRVFGSFARNEMTDESDIDFLLTMESDRSLFDLGGFQYETEALLKRKVDVVLEKSLHPVIREDILQEARPL